MLEKLTRRDWITIAVCALIFVASLAVALAFFDDAFPEASIDFRYDRNESRPIAERALARIGTKVDGYKHAAEFGHDNDAKIFLERSLGVEKANAVTRSDVKIWFWRHRWFKPEQPEEFRVDIAPTGELVALRHILPEDVARPSATEQQSIETARSFLLANGIDITKLKLLTRSERQLPKRVEQTLTWESRTTRPAGAPYRYVVTVRGDKVSSFQQELRVPEQWLREYSELRSKNNAAGMIDQLLMLVVIVAVVVVFLRRLKRQEVDYRFSVLSGTVAGVLVTLVALNSYPSELANYDTTTSFATFLAKFVFFAVLQGVGSGIFLMLIVGAGEVYFRKSYPQHLAIPRLFQAKALGSKRVMIGFIVGYTLFAAFLAYQVLFYITASKYGAWSPADIPYDDFLNTLLPWAAVLFMGFFPAMSEEYLSRAFSIPFFEKLFRSRVAAIVIAGFMWGFGHAMYPNQPFYIRGLEVGIAGVIIGLLMVRFGLLPLLVWHYTVDALYTALLLFRSGNAYYIASAALATLIFLIPLLASIVLYVRRGGFIPDDDLSNAAAPVADEEPESAAPEPSPMQDLPAAPVRTSRFVVVTLVLVAIAAAGIAVRRGSVTRATEFRITEAEAIDIARAHLDSLGYDELPARTVGVAAGGFRSWDDRSGREEGGQAHGFDSIAAEYILQQSDRPWDTLRSIIGSKVPAGTWVIRFFTPLEKNEFIVEVDPRSARAIGFHEFVDERTSGARLERETAEFLGVAAMARYGFKVEAFELKDALSFEQPSRRDWLLHFQERNPLAGEAHRRLTVRVAGDRVVQFTRTIKIPEKAIREAEEETLINLAIMLAKLAGGLLFAILVILGALGAARQHGLPWRWAGRITLLLTPLPLLTLATRWKTFAASYDTSVPWETFVVQAGTSVVTMLLFWMGGVFLALAVLKAAFDEAPLYLSKEGRRRFGADALLRTLTATAALVILAVALNWIRHVFPTAFEFDGVDPSPVLTASFPLIGAIWNTLSQAIMGTAIFAALAALVRDAKPEHRNRIIAALLASIVLFSLDPSVRTHQLAASIGAAVAEAALMWIVFFRILRGNPLAYFTTPLFLLAARYGGDLWEHSRHDLRVNAILFTAIAVLVALWLLGGRREDVPRESSPAFSSPD